MLRALHPALAGSLGIRAWAVFAVSLLSLAGCTNIQKDYQLNGYKPLPPGCVAGAKDRLTKRNRHVEPKNSPECRQHLQDYVWPYADAPRPKLPEAPPQTHGLDLAHADQQMKKEYFEWLCRSEAGVFLYRQAPDADSVMNLRPRWPKDDYEHHEHWMSADLYYLEDPLGWLILDAGDATNIRVAAPQMTFRGKHEGGYWYQLSGWRNYEVPLNPEEQKKHGGKRFARFESWIPKGARWETRADQQFVVLNEGHRKLLGVDFRKQDSPKYEPRVVYTDTPLAKYGFFSREIVRSPYDRALGIAGTEVFTVNLRTGEILSVVRLFMNRFGAGRFNEALYVMTCDDYVGFEEYWDRDLHWVLYMALHPTEIDLNGLQ